MPRVPEELQFVDEPVVPRAASPAVTALGDLWRQACAIGMVLRHAVSLWLLMLFAWSFGYAGRSAGGPGEALAAIALPAAAIGCALCVDFAQRCFYEDAAKTGRPRAVAIMCGMGWTAMSWVCAYALGRAM